MSSIITSKNTIADNGLVTGITVDKDMSNQYYADEFDPYEYQSQFFPGMADFIDENIVQGDKLEENRLYASRWDDLYDDVFDGWGFFYLYDVQSGKYYFPQLYPQNEDDGVFNTQTCNAFGRTFTINHGWAVQGIFKIDIDVSDNLPFRFGAYGDMGSDGDEDIIRFKRPNGLIYSDNDISMNINLYYLKHAEQDDSNEILYSYFIPKNPSQNTERTYIFNNDGEYNNIMSKNVNNGLLVYFSKGNDVYNWVISDLNNVTDPSPSSASIIEDSDPISNICFPAGTPIKTDQGVIPIDKINTNIHTIRNNKIVTITKTITQDSFLVCIEKDALAKNIPSEQTLITRNHELFYNGKMIKAIDLLNKINNDKTVYKVKYSGEFLYNILLEKHDKMIVNNLICETLNPINGIAKMHYYIKQNNFTDKEKQEFINKYNKYTIKNKTFTK